MKKIISYIVGVFKRKDIFKEVDKMPIDEQLRFYNSLPKRRTIDLLFGRFR